MRASLQKLLESKIKRQTNYLNLFVFLLRLFFFPACEMKNPTMNQYLNALDNSGWLQHIRSVLEAAIFIARVSEKIDYE